ncbi:MAG TPA: hypothetical protein VK717_03130 [Opitutaceae bacterium]|nr:hypothetical protein [Opitutaceae bacterium]
MVIAIAVASLLQKLKKVNTQQQAREVMDADADAPERTRRVQEEIRRKIAERTGRAQTDARPRPQPPVIARGGPPAEQRRNIFQELARQMAEAKKVAEARARAASEQQAQSHAQAEERARDLAEAQRAAAEQSRLATVAALRRDREPRTAAGAGGKLLPELRGPASLKRAIVLREILGPPVGLR